MTLSYLSFDCAIKSLGITLLTINTHLLNPTSLTIDSSTPTTLINTVNNVLSNLITIESCGTYDIIPDKKIKDISEVDRCNALIQFIKNSPYNPDLLPKNTISYI